MKRAVEALYPKGYVTNENKTENTTIKDGFLTVISIKGLKKMTQIKRQSAVILLYSDTYGTNIPQMFINEMDLEQWQGIPDDAKTILNDKDHELYWEMWDDILQNAVYTDENGNEYRLNQDGDLWLIDLTRMTCKEKENFGWRIEESERHAEALVLALGDNIEEREYVSECGHDENIYKYNGNSYLVVSDEEADRRAHDAINESLWAFNASFILDHVPGNFSNRAIEAFRKMQQELCEDANELIAAMIGDLHAFAENAISEEGRGHFLSQYDGEELEHGEFYIYRID